MVLMASRVGIERKCRFTGSADSRYSQFILSRRSSPTLMERSRCCAGAQAKTCAGHKQTPSTHLPDTNPVKDSGRVRCRHLCQACCPLKDWPTAIWNLAQIQYHACINQYDSLLGEVNGWKWIDYESCTLWLPESIWFDWPSCSGAGALLLWYSKVDFVLDHRLFNGP